MYSTRLSSTFSVFKNFLKWKSGDLIPWGEPILQNGWIIWSPLLCFYIRNLKHPNSSSFITFQCMLHDLAALLWVFKTFLKLKKGNLLSWEEPILQNHWVVWSPFCLSILQIRRPKFFVNIRFQCILHDSAILFSVFRNFLKSRTGHLNTWGKPILENGRIIWSPLFLSILEIWGT